MPQKIIRISAILLFLFGGTITTPSATEPERVLAELPKEGSKKKGKSHFTMISLIPKLQAKEASATAELMLHHDKTFAFLEASDFMNAFIEASEALRSEPKSAVSHYLLGASLMGLADFAAASVEFKEALSLDPSLLDAHFMLAQALRLSGHYDEAKSEYNRVLKERAKDSVSMAFLADIHRAEGNWWLCQQKCSEAMKAKPGSPLPHTVLGYALITQGKLAAGIAEHEAAVKLASSDPYVYFRFGQSLASIGLWQAAEAELRKALLLDPKYADAITVLSWVISNQKDRSAEAVSMAQRAASMAPNDVDIHNALAMLFINRGEHDKAVSEYKKSLSLRPDNRKIQRALALELKNTEHLDEAIVELSIAAQEFPLDEELKLALRAVLNLKQKERSLKNERPYDKP